MKIEAGKLTRRCVLSAPVKSRALNGEALEVFGVVGTRWCSQLTLLPREVELQAQLASQAEAKVLMRHDSLTRTITEAWRVEMDPDTPEARHYEVVGMDPNQRDGSMLVFLAGSR